MCRACIGLQLNFIAFIGIKITNNCMISLSGFYQKKSVFISLGTYKKYYHIITEIPKKKINQNVKPL